jgi:hypothetical protein
MLDMDSSTFSKLKKKRVLAACIHHQIVAPAYINAVCRLSGAREKKWESKLNINK